MTVGLQIRKATVNDIPGMKSLFNANVTPPKSTYFFQWWSGIPSVTYCAIEAGEVIGMFVVLKRKLINNLNCGVLMGLLVNSSWRGKGLFKELGDKAMEHFKDIDLFCCLTNEVGEKALEKNFNFRTISNIETMVLAGNANTSYCRYIRTPITSDTSFNNFKQEKKNSLMFLADEEFRRWRFALHHRYSYDMILIDSNEFAIINKYYNKETNIRYGDIIDFETETMEEKRLIDIINCAYLSLNKDVDMVTIQAVPNSLLYAVSKKIGFKKSSIKHCFSIKVKEPANEYLYDSSRWLIKWGDYLR
jgi:hypothetical protein